MVPLRFDKARIAALLERAGAQLTGDWLLIGGAAAAAWFSAERTTEDVDLIGLAGTSAERLALMDLAVEAGIPIEAVNSAADFFVRRIDGWRAELVPLVRGPSATVYRPSPTLFLLLKLARLTATDLEDCLGLLAHCAVTGDAVDAARVAARLNALAPTEDKALAARRSTLRTALGG